MKGSLLSVYKQFTIDAPFEPSREQVSARSLKNVALQYLLTPEEDELVA